MKYKDYYSLLEIKRTASADEIKKAYRKFAKMYHPDANIGNPEAEEKIKEINEAYEVLSNERNKRKYDMLINRFSFIHGFDFDPQKFGFKKKREFEGKSEGAFSDFFNLFFENEADEFEMNTFESGFSKNEEPLLFKKGNDVMMNFDITLEEAFSGLETEVRVREMGNKVKKYPISIPAGVHNGDTIKLLGKGMPGLIGAPPGDLYVKIIIKKHDKFTIKGNDLEIDVPISPWEAVLGCRAVVPSIDGKLNIKVPAGVQAENRLRITGKGYVCGNKRGDLLGRVKIVVPKEPTDEEKELFEKLQAVSHFEPRNYENDII